MTEQKLVAEKTVAEWIGMSVVTLRKWRFYNQGPRYLKLGGSVRYRMADVESWLATRQSGGERTAA